MSSSAKSTHLGLNKWISSDKPEMNDFNTDNSIIDEVLGVHVADVNKHMNQSERTKWNNPYSIVHYVGDGTASRAVSLNTGFVTTVCIVYAEDKPMVATDSLSGNRRHYFGVATSGAGSQGVMLDRTLLLVDQGESPNNMQDIISFNENGVRYSVLCFR